MEKQSEDAHQKVAFREIFADGASRLTFKELYRNVYNLALHRHGGELYDSVLEEFMEQVESIVHVVSAVSEDHVLEALTQQWTSYQQALSMVRDVVAYMDRTYVKKSKGTKPGTYEAGVQLFRDTVVYDPSISERAQRLFAQYVDDQQGKHVDNEKLRAFSQVLVGHDVQHDKGYDACLAFTAPSLEDTQDTHQQT
ncbi:hypothetical protein Poli38472_010462 [Pythium oligandrum]|uniref:Cullin N-terminal domain-containing protein n=1 Tax=Pythium oligandrum TaxID=41045 RepID=A0A8K1C369_PYTOL|nr:hypothetical protein Poli38472_010462 [Pythium oligandrum]|eukprot:TMW55580.1 hypothetical protein Poli38472_010462 [Pythium oligandrum]